ncbi:MAG: cytochrome c [Saprospiraceae bacterium]|nr:cytochrome c [Saprospiraceae bacterium]
MKKYSFFLLLTLFALACGGEKPESGDKPARPNRGVVVDDGKGVGEITSVELNNPLNAEMVAHGKEISELKCAACHRLTAQRVVGPGWAGVTTRRKPEWIMNMVTNVEVMLDEDPAAQALLKECLTRMPNQNLTLDDARDVLEFMYANDGQPVAGN